MDLIIQEKLKEIYKKLTIEVETNEIRKYEIKTKIEYHGIVYESKIEYWYDVTKTLEYNLDKITNIIDNKIIILFYKSEG